MGTQDALAPKIQKNLTMKNTEILFFPILKNSFTPLQDKATVRFFRYCHTFFCFCYLWGMLGSSHAAGTAHSSAHCWDLATLMCWRVWNTCCKFWTFKNSFIYSSLTELSEVALPSASSMAKRQGGEKRKRKKHSSTEAFSVCPAVSVFQLPSHRQLQQGQKRFCPFRSIMPIPF